MCRTPITSSKTHGFIPPTFPSAHITCSCSGPTYSFVLFILLFFSQTPGPTKDPLPKPSTVDPTPTHAFPWWWWWLDDERERAPFLAFCVEDKGETGVHRMKKNIFSPTIPRPYSSYYFCKNNKKKKWKITLFSTQC